MFSSLSSFAHLQILTITSHSTYQQWSINN